MGASRLAWFGCLVSILVAFSPAWGAVAEPAQSLADVTAFHGPGSWDLAGQRVAVAATGEATQSSLVVLEATRPERAEIFGVNGTIRGISWSPSGRAIAIGVAASTDQRVMKLSLQTSRLEPICSAALWPAYAPDGSYLAFLRPRLDGTYDIWVRQGLREVRLTSERAEAAVTGPVLWSPDSRRLAYAAGNHSVASLAVVDIRKKIIRTSPRSCGLLSRNSRPVWLGCSQCVYVRWLLVGSSRDSVVWNLDQGRCRVLWPGLPMAVFRAVQLPQKVLWSLKYSFEAKRLLLARTPQGGRTQVVSSWVDEEPTENATLAWSPSGQWGCLVRDSWLSFVNESGVEVESVRSGGHAPTTP